MLDAGLGSVMGNKRSQQGSSSVLGLDTSAANLLPPGGNRLRVPAVFNSTCWAKGAGKLSLFLSVPPPLPPTKHTHRQTFHVAECDE